MVKSKFLRLQLPSPRKLNQAGFDHVLVAVFCVVAVGVVGAALVVKSHAQTAQWTGRLEVFNNNSGYCLTTTTGSEGGYAVLDPCSSTYNADQVWSVVDTATYSSGSIKEQEFNIRSAANSNECLNDWQDNTSNNWQVRLYTCSTAKANTWVWSVQVAKATGDFTTHQLGNMEASKCLDDYYGSKAQNNKVQLYTCKETGQVPSNQEWFEDAAPSTSSTSTSSSTTWSGALQNGYNRKYCMNDNNSSTTSKAPIGIYSCENAVSEKWYIAKNGSGQFLLKNGQGVCADDTAVATQANLETYTCNSADHAQLWEWTASHQIENVYSKSCINDPGSSTTNGKQLTVTSCSGNPASEQWYESVL